MSGFLRKIRRNLLKKELGNNKIRQAYHLKYDSLEKRLRDGFKNTRKK